MAWLGMAWRGRAGQGKARQGFLRGGNMGNFIFVMLHLIAVLFGFWMLIITIPAHLIYSAIVGKKQNETSRIEKVA